MTIPLFKVHMAADVDEYVLPVLRSGYVGQGSEVDAFESELAATIETPYDHRIPKSEFITTNSCTSAIHLALLLLDVQPGDEVITTPITCVATNSPIVMMNARPVWADVDYKTGNIKAASIGARLTRRTRAIIAVDWAGRPCDYGALCEYDLPVIQDAAHNPLIDPENCGDFVCWSFGPIKHLTSGDGGALITPEEYEAEARRLRWYGLDRRSSKDFRCGQDIEHVGSKFHMNDVNAAIGRANLPHLNEIVNAHKRHAKKMHLSIRNPDIEVQPYVPLAGYWVMPLRTSSPKALRPWLASHGIESSRVHARTDKHTGFQYPGPALPGVDDFDAHQLNVPCGWWLSDADVDHIIATLNAWRVE